MIRLPSVRAGGLALLLLVLGLALWLAPGAGGPAHGAPTAPLRPRPTVLVRAPVVKDLTRRVSVPADVLAWSDATVLARVSGYAAEVRADVGTRVERDAVLLRVDVPDLHAAVATAQARSAQATAALAEARARALQARSLATESGAALTTARAEQARAVAERERAAAEAEYRGRAFQRLAQTRSAAPQTISDDLVDEGRGRHEAAQASLREAAARVGVAEAGVAAAAARIESAQAAVAAADAGVDASEAAERAAQALLSEVEVRRSFAEVRAPFRGVVVERRVDVGDFVRDGVSGSGASTPLFRVLDTSRMRVRFRLAEGDAAACGQGARLQLRVDALGERTFDATVSRWAEALDLATRTLHVEADLPNPDGVLRHGLFGRLRVDLESHRAALVVPAEAVLTSKRKSSVLVVEAGRVARKPVRIGADDGIEVQILEGLSAADRVIVRGGAQVAPGEAVEAVEDVGGR